MGSLKTQNPVSADDENDDAPVGRVWSRRELLGLLAAAGGSLTLAACAPMALPAATATPVPAGTVETDATATPAPGADATAAAVSAQDLPVDCVVSPELTEGPYFVDVGLNRSDIRADTAGGAVREGAMLTLALAVAQVANNACTPLANALVDIWHCDAEGVYSGVTDRSFDTTSQDFLRGQQVTDANGQVQFVTIYPGWYSGRAVHIHFKVRSAADGGGTWEFTSQFFFDDAFTDQVYTAAPYSSRTGRDTLNSNDGIFQGGGSQLLLPVTADGDGYRAAFTIGMVV